jgi:hypothetical protein
MKNIHLIPTDKPSRLFKDDFGKYFISINIDQEQNHFKPQHIYITSDEEIKEGDWVYYLHNSGLHEPRIMEVIKPNYSDYKPYSIHFKSGFGVQEDCKKIILTTDQDLIKDGIQAIDDEFLEWFVKNPSCESVEVTYDKDIYPYGVETAKGYGWYKIIIPQEEPKQEIKNDISVSSRIEHITDKEQLKIIEFIIDYSFKDKKEIYTNGTILVPLFRVLDAISQKGEPYQSS